MKFLAKRRFHQQSKEIIRNLPLLVQGGYYIACAQGLHRTDIALLMNFLFNPKSQEPPIMYGHFKNGRFRCDDIFYRASCIYRALSQDDKISLGLDEEFEDSFLKRKKILTETQNNYIMNISMTTS